MAGVYVDTSALGRVLLGEADAEAVVRELAGYEQHVASRLLRLELCRLALRENVLGQAEQLLTGLALLPLDEAVLHAAETIEPAGVATLDAIHLVTALHLFDHDLIAAVMTYDARLADGVRRHGLTVLAPV